MHPPSNAALSEGSLVLVTGANGFLAAEVVRQLLALGYREPPGLIWPLET